jgi:tetratricopeptide (TPR) repeat protein
MMRIAARRTIRSVDKLLVYLLDMDFKVSAVLTPDPGQGNRRKLSSEQGAPGKLKVHYIDFGDDEVGLLEWDELSKTGYYDVRLYRGESLAASGAIETAVKAISDYPDSCGDISSEQQGRLLEMEALAWFMAKDYDRARSTAECIVKMNPRVARAWICLGACCSTSSDDSKAVHYYLKAIHVDHSIFRAWVNLGNRYRSLGDELRALVAYSVCLALPDTYRGDDSLRKQVCNILGSGKVLDRYGSYLRRMRDKELSMLWRDSENGMRTEVNYGTGIELMHAGEYEKAIEELQKALGAAPEDPSIQNDLAHCQLRAGRTGEALKTIESALSLFGDHITLLVTKAEILMKLSRHSEALECYSKAIDLDGADAAAIYSKALAEDHMGMKEEAEKTFKHFMAVSNGTFESQVNYARCRLQEYEYWRD